MGGSCQRSMSRRSPGLAMRQAAVLSAHEPPRGEAHRPTRRTATGHGHRPPRTRPHPRARSPVRPQCLKKMLPCVAKRCVLHTPSPYLSRPLYLRASRPHAPCNPLSITYVTSSAPREWYVCARFRTQVGTPLPMPVPANSTSIMTTPRAPECTGFGCCQSACKAPMTHAKKHAKACQGEEEHPVLCEAQRSCWASSARLRERSCFKLWRVVKFTSDGAIEPALSSSQSLDFLFGLAELGCGKRHAWLSSALALCSKMKTIRSSSCMPDAVAGFVGSSSCRSLPLMSSGPSIAVSSEASELCRLGDGPSGAQRVFDGDILDGPRSSASPLWSCKGPQRSG